MDRRRSAALALFCALVLAAAPAMATSGRLDLDVDPAQVAKWDAEPPPHDQVIGASPGAEAAIAPGAKEPGWSLRPAVDVDISRDEGERAEGGAGERSLDLGDMDIDLESVGVRLQQTW